VKTIEELQLKPEHVTVITPKVISDAIEEIARGKRVFAQFYRENRDLVGPGKPHEIAFPKKKAGIAAAWDVPPGSVITYSTMTYEAVTISVKKGGVQVRITNEAIEAAMRDVIRDQIQEAGLVWAETIDTIALKEMLDVKETISSDISTDGKTITLGHAPVLKIVGISGATIEAVDYYDGKVKLTASVPAATVTFEYSARCESTGLYVDAKSKGSLTAWDILMARAKIISANYSPNVMVFHDADIPTLLYDEKVKFLEVSAYGGREALLNAEIGKIFGLRTVTTTRTYEGIGIYIDTTALGYDVHKRDLKGVREDKPEYDSIWYHFWAERGFGVVNDEAVCVSVNHKYGKYPAADY